MAEPLKYLVELALERVDPEEPEQDGMAVARALQEDILLGVEFWAGGDNGLDSLTGYRIAGATVTPTGTEPDGQPAAS